jgi:hypothetical protein
LNELGHLENEEFPTEEEFFDAVAKHIGNESTVVHKDLILEYARPHEFQTHSSKQLRALLAIIERRYRARLERIRSPKDPDDLLIEAIIELWSGDPQWETEVVTLESLIEKIKNVVKGKVSNLCQHDKHFPGADIDLIQYYAQTIFELPISNSK